MSALPNRLPDPHPLLQLRGRESDLPKEEGGQEAAKQRGQREQRGQRGQRGRGRRHTELDAAAAVLYDHQRNLKTPARKLRCAHPMLYSLLNAQEHVYVLLVCRRRAPARYVLDIDRTILCLLFSS